MRVLKGVTFVAIWFIGALLGEVFFPNTNSVNWIMLYGIVVNYICILSTEYLFEDCN